MVIMYGQNGIYQLVSLFQLFKYYIFKILLKLIECGSPMAGPGQKDPRLLRFSHLSLKLTTLKYSVG